MNQTPLSDPEETRTLYAALDSFRQYRRVAHYNITHLRRQSFYSLPAAQVELLSAAPFALPRKFDAVDEAIDSNADIAEALLNYGLPSFGVDSGSDACKGFATSNDLDKARSTIRQLYRDWSAEGVPERNASYTPILDALARYLTSPPSKRHRHYVLVPGAGLGRLVFDICAAGYTVEGNEISYHQLLASNYILNGTRMAGQHKLYPWALSFSNHQSRANQLQPIRIPDIHPGTALEASSTEIQSDVSPSERMSMTSGDFCVLYRQVEYKDTFSAVATCFFVDTAPNVISYIETIRHCLEPGGIWINLGPLLWHFESAPTPAERDKQRTESDREASFHPHNVGIAEPGSFELSNEEVKSLVCKFGFEMLEETDIPAGATGYIQDPMNMLQNVYRPTFWVAKKHQTEVVQNRQTQTSQQRDD